MKMKSLSSAVVLVLVGVVISRVEGGHMQGHENFWSDPKFFASLTDYLTAPEKQKELEVGVAKSQVIVPEFDSLLPQEEGGMDEMEVSGSENVERVVSKPEPHPLQTPLGSERKPHPLPTPLIAKPDLEQFTPEDVLSLLLANLPRPHPHPNKLQMNGKRRRRPYPTTPNPVSTTTSTKTTPTTTTTTTPRPTTTPPQPQHDYSVGDYEYDQVDEYSAPQPSISLPGFSYKSKNAETRPQPPPLYRQYQYPIQTAQSLDFYQQPRPQVLRYTLPQNLIIAAPDNIVDYSEPIPAQVKVQTPFTYPPQENDVEGQTPGLVSRLSDILETGRKILYFPKGVVDVVDHAMAFAETNPYFNLAMGTMADTLFGTTHLSHAKGIQPKVANKGTPTQLLVAKPFKL